MQGTEEGPSKLFCAPPCVVSQLVGTVLQGQGIWKMQFQGLDMPLLQLETIIEHGDGQISAEKMEVSLRL